MPYPDYTKEDIDEFRKRNFMLTWGMTSWQCINRMKEEHEEPLRKEEERLKVLEEARKDKKARIESEKEARRENQPSFRYDKRNDDWKLLENTPRRLTSTNIKVISFTKGTESQINGEEMVRRAIELDANYGQEDAEYLLEHQDEIPAELREFYLVFPGTKWQDSFEDRFVPYLDWDDGQWILGFGWLSGDWGSSGRLVRPRKPACR